ncbi:MAG: DUF2314 domain-containing protein [Rubripirellula sp.]
MEYWLIGILIGGGLFALYRWRNSKQTIGQDDDHKMLSFVALLKEPQLVETLILANAAQKAWGADLGDDTHEGEDGFVVGESPSFVIQHQGQMILVNSFADTYVPDPEQAANSIADLRLRGLFTEHRAWISCDAMGIESLDDVEEVRGWYQRLGPLLSELVDDNCLAIFLPQTNQLFANMEETLDMLKSDDPLAALHEEAPVPVIQISDDDPRMIAAVQEARDRWPEFLSAFEQKAGENFGVKVPISAGGNTEFIWSEVGAVEQGIIYGRLANEPMNLGDLKLGSQVRARIEDLNDWAYIDAQGESHGLFTVQVLADAEKQRQQQMIDEPDGQDGDGTDSDQHEEP